MVLIYRDSLFIVYRKKYVLVKNSYKSTIPRDFEILLVNTLLYRIEFLINGFWIFIHDIVLLINLHDKESYCLSGFEEMVLFFSKPKQSKEIRLARVFSLSNLTLIHVVTAVIDLCNPKIWFGGDEYNL